MKANTSDYGHVNEKTDIFDIGPNESRHSSHDRNYFNKSITVLEGKDLDSKSKLYGEGGENAYHIVIK